MELKFQVQTKVAKPADEVFDAIINPKKLTKYFISESSGPLVEGSQATWRFAEHDGDVLVKVTRVVPNERIVFEWEAADDKHEDTRVEIEVKRLDDDATLLQISESGWRETPEGLKASYSNCYGWSHMSLCLKAFLEHGINLRAGGVVC